MRILPGVKIISKQQLLDGVLLMNNPQLGSQVASEGWFALITSHRAHKAKAASHLSPEERKIDKFHKSEVVPCTLVGH